MDIACTVVAPGDVVAAVAVVGDAVEDDAESVTDDVEVVAVTHKSEVRVEWSDYIQKRVGDSVSLPGSGPTVGPSRLDSGDSVQEPSEEVEGQAHCIRFVEDKSAEKASEEEGKSSGVHMNYMPGH